MILRELHLATGQGARAPTRLEHGPGPSPSLQALLDLPQGHHAAAWTLDGGEPTLREDLPTLIAGLSALPRLGMVTDGLALGSADRVQALRSWGLQRVRLRLHSARPEAHDWLVDLPGSHRRALRALRLCVEQGLETEVECVLTRPAMDQLPELTALVFELGARRLLLRRLEARGPAAQDFVALSPRFGLAQPLIEAAWDEARRRARNFHSAGFPACALGRARETLLPPDAESWLSTTPDGAYAPAPTAAGCVPCPGGAACAGAPLDYVQRFGWAEIRSEDHGRGAPNPVRQSPEPPPRAGRSPATRLSWPQRALRLPSLGADPVGDRPLSAPQRLRFALRGPSPVACPSCGDHADALPEFEPLREARARLALIAQQGAEILELGGAVTLHHPDAVELLREACALPFAQVHAWGDGAALGELGEGPMRKLRRLRRVSLALYGPDAQRHDAHAGRPGAFDATLRALQKLREQGVPELGVYALLHGPEELPAWDKAWSMGDLPSPIQLSLSPAGGDLNQLVGVSRTCSADLRAALRPSLPACLGGQAGAMAPLIDWRPGRDGRLSSSSPVPSLGPCADCGDLASACPGLAVGWSFNPHPPEPPA